MITKVDTDTMVLIIEQFLLLILIMGRFMMPRVLNSICTVEKEVALGLIKASFKNSNDLKPTFTQTYRASNQGEMTRDELAQLLLCYIGTAADIIEFFDSFKVNLI